MNLLASRRLGQKLRQIPRPQDTCGKGWTRPLRLSTVQVVAAGRLLGQLGDLLQYLRELVVALIVMVGPYAGSFLRQHQLAHTTGSRSARSCGAHHERIGNLPLPPSTGSGRSCGSLGGELVEPHGWGGRGAEHPGRGGRPRTAMAGIRDGPLWRALWPPWAGRWR